MLQFSPQFCEDFKLRRRAQASAANGASSQAPKGPPPPPPLLLLPVSVLPPLPVPGCVTAVACTVTLLVTGWPSFWLLQVRLKLFSPSTASTTGTLLPLVCCAPLQAPLAVQLLAWVVDQLR